MGKRFDAGCKEIFYEQTVNITRKGNRKLKVRRDHKTGLLHIPIHNQQTGKKNLPVETYKHEYNVDQTKNLPDQIKYLHESAFSPVQ